jgi:hypothetical protein
MAPPPPGEAERERRDSAATLFGNRAGTPGGGGYNQASYSTIGRAEPVKGGWDEEDAGLAPTKDDAWDVYADFNNAGPKYSSSYGNPHAYVSGRSHMCCEPDTRRRYEPVGSPGLKHDDERTLSNPGDPGHVELVTVPALGAEWKASELRDMTSSGKRARKAEDRGARWNAFRRGHRGLCGIPWLTRKVLTFVTFGLIIAAGIALAFTLPRVPGFALSIATPLMNATGSWADAVPTAFIRAPGANFSFPAFADVQVDTGSSYLALTLMDLNATVTDSQTNFIVATGHIARQVLKAHSLEYMLIPLNFSYTAPNASDQTCPCSHPLSPECV